MVTKRDRQPFADRIKCIDSQSSALSAALSKSDSIAILQKNLNISRAQYKQTVAANSVSLNGSLGGGATGGIGNTTLLSAEAGTVGTSVDYTTDIPLNYSGSLSLSGPSTSLSLAGGASFSPAESMQFSDSSVSLSLSQTVWDGYPGGIAKGNVMKGLHPPIRGAVRRLE